MALHFLVLEEDNSKSCCEGDGRHCGVQEV